MTRKELDLQADIRDFTTLFFVILRRKSSEWSESYIERTLNDRGMRNAVWSLN